MVSPPCRKRYEEEYARLVAIQEQEKERDDRLPTWARANSKPADDRIIDTLHREEDIVGKGAAPVVGRACACAFARACARACACECARACASVSEC